MHTKFPFQNIVLKTSNIKTVIFVMFIAMNIINL